MQWIEQETDSIAAQQIFQWLREDSARFHALKTAATLALPDWCIAAGFVRNLVWDRLFETPHHQLNDLDLIYFDPTDTAESKDLAHEQTLAERSAFPWSVKNQARMHARNADPCYTSTTDAMSYWVEIETAIGVRWHPQTDQLCLLSPFSLTPLMSGTLTLNPKRPKPQAFNSRISNKNWLKNWPRLRVITENLTTFDN